MSETVAPVLSTRELADVRAPIERALGLPARAFTSQAFFDLEVRRVFHRSWMGLCFEATLPHPGDMRPLTLFDMPLVAVRGDDERVRVFHNICPYDGCLAVRSPVAGARGIEVYYHGWRYDLRGRLEAAPYWDATRQGSPDALGGRDGNLVEVRSETRLGVVFIDLGGAAGGIDPYLAPLLELLHDYELEALVTVEDDRTLAREGRALRANWKTYLENAAINILHEAFTHDAYRRSPEIPRVRDGERTCFTVASGPLLAFGFELENVRQTYGFGGQTPHLGRRPGSPPRQGFFVTYYPNLALPVRYDMVRMGICLPVSPASTRVLQCTRFHRDAPRHPDFPAYHRSLVDRYATVYAEDAIAIEAVQAGRRSPVWQRHFYAPFWDELHHRFNNLVADDLAAEG